MKKTKKQKYKVGFYADLENVPYTSLEAMRYKVQIQDLKNAIKLLQTMRRGIDAKLRRLNNVNVHKRAAKASTRS